MKRKCIMFVLAAAVGLFPSAQASGRYKILHNFPYGTSDGSQPYGPLLLDSQENLYGVTANGGGPSCSGAGCGTVFELTQHPNGKWSEQILHAFTDTGDGAFPQGNLVQDTVGNLYGTDGTGDWKPHGVFELAPSSGGWNVSLIYTKGNNPGLLIDGAANLYGFMGPGGIAELSPSSHGWVYSDLYDFCQKSCYDGSEPVAPLTWDANGNLYGTTLFGGNGGSKCPGSAGCGVAFQMTRNGDGTWTYHVLHRFAQFNRDGYYPYAGLVVDASGNAYGVTWAGGRYDNGTFYKLTPTKQGLWKETILYEFPNCKNGCGPNESLVFDKAGHLYGAGAGGNMTCGYSCGVIYKLTPQKNGKWKYSVLHKFNNTDGSGPYSVVLDGKGDIFGTTFGGGKYGWGVAFEITP